MSEVNINERINTVAKDYAKKILEQTQDIGEAQDLAHQYANEDDWVIYPDNAHILYQYCNTEGGEKYLEETWPNTKMSYDDLTSIMAYGELRSRIMAEINKQIN